MTLDQTRHNVAQDGLDIADGLASPVMGEYMVIVTEGIHELEIPTNDVDRLSGRELGWSPT
jgi:hypothetical protein